MFENSNLKFEICKLKGEKMLLVKFDSKGKNKIKWPGIDIAIIETARELITAESELADSECFPKRNLLKNTLKNAEEALGLVSIEDSGTVIDEEDAFNISKDFARVIVAGLTYFHNHELSKLEEWGVIVVNDKPQTPINKRDIAVMLEKYVEKEESLQQSDRLPSPPLEQVIAVKKALLSAQEKRDQKKEKPKGRPEEVSQLLDLLQLAVSFHVVCNFDGVVDERLEKLGFEIVETAEKKVRKQKTEAEEQNVAQASRLEDAEDEGQKTADGEQKTDEEEQEKL